ncbi:MULTISPECIES: hypothetical protein [Asticcacaulis]|uniref:hypothetical protein n=1 Tax=Asticcacaulis TaxID=76890 RepID=UPI001AEAE62C|nr:MULTISPECIES: hypothetical protein [Asticcacaulis]MBP2161385.1 hypothetical protein [Asticcacaulis solisilvae]MDR6802430.1 hypothetical protein [Asticcacaulis sp. BE141]
MNPQSVTTRYTFGIMGFMALYVAALFLSILTIEAQKPTGPLLYLLAVLPALPVGGTIWVFLRYIDKVDEYVRAVVTKRFILATGLTLFACTAWGFLENNAGAHEFSLYLVYPVWWGLFGLSSVFYRNAQ